MAELRNIKWGRLAKDLLKYREPIVKSRSLQWWLTVALRQQGYVILDEQDYIIEYKGVRFKPHTLNYPRMFEAWDRYRIEALRPDDRVLDLGANIGSYTIPAAQRVYSVIAVEPIFNKELEENIGLNKLSNIKVIEGTIGSKQADCQEYSKWAQRVDLVEIVEDIQPTVVRLDIGGAENKFLPYSFGAAVRLFELEFHFPNKGLNLSMWFKWFEEKNFGWIARWSKSKHWLYISAGKDLKVQKLYHLKDGSFTGDNLKMWKGEL